MYSVWCVLRSSLLLLLLSEAVTGGMKKPFRALPFLSLTLIFTPFPLFKDPNFFLHIAEISSLSRYSPAALLMLSSQLVAYIYVVVRLIEELFGRPYRMTEELKVSDPSVPTVSFNMMRLHIRLHLGCCL